MHLAVIAYLVRKLLKIRNKLYEFIKDKIIVTILILGILFKVSYN